jgi:hypothetical protein
MKATFVNQNGLTAHFGEVVNAMTERLPDYDGEYTVTPLASISQILQTKDKSLNENIVVLEIPVYEVSNEYGTTITIGG